MQNVGNGTMTPGSRSAAALRFCASLVLSAAVALLLIWLQPQQLSVVTDIVGYPIHFNFNYQRLFWRSYVWVLFAPALAAAIYHVIGFRWPGARWPDAKAPPPQPAEGEDSRWALVFQGIFRALVVGATLGLGCVFLESEGGARFWRDVAGVALAYAMVLIVVAAVLARRASSGRSFVEMSALLNAVSTPLTLASLYAVSRTTRMTVMSDGSVHTYSWLPGWIAGAATVVLVAVALTRCSRARHVAAIRRIEAQGLLFLVAPILLYVYTARLPPPLGGFDAFHAGEFLAAARLFAEGAFPWRDSIFIHGLYQDVLTPLAGFKLYGDSAWGAWAGFQMVAEPIWWIANYLLCVYLFRRNPMLLVAAFAVPLLGAYAYAHWRFALLPFILLALAAFLERATWSRSFLLGIALVGSNVLVPELAYAVPACGLALGGYELSRYRRDLGVLANFPRTVRVTVVGVALAGVWFAYLASHHAAGAFLHYYTTFVPGHALTGAIPHGRGVDFFIYMLLPPLLVVLAFWYAVAAVRMRWALDVRDWVMLALVLVTALYYQKFLSRPDWHIAHSVAPALPLLYYAFHKAQWLCGFRSPRALAVAGGLILAATVLLAPGGLPELARVPPNFARTVPQPAAIERMGWSDSALAPEVVAFAEIGRFVDATLDPGDALFDFTNQPGLYHYVLRRKPATRYYHVSMAVRRSTQLDLIEELDRTRPKLVVFDSESSGLPDWDGVPNEVRHYEISRYILRHYRPLARLHGQVFYGRNDLSLESRVPRSSAEILTAPEAYLQARACNWGYAPRFWRGEGFEIGPVVERGTTIVAQRLTMSGWAADAQALQPAREAVVFAQGTLLARATPAVHRPVVGRAINASALDRSGFSIFVELAADRRLARDDLRAYAISLEGKASPLHTSWVPTGPEPTDFRIEKSAPIPLSSGASMGLVDTVELELESISSMELPAGVRLADVSGLEFDVQASGDSSVIISDQPFIRPDHSNSASELVRSPMFFRIPAHTSGAIRVMVDNCPQWYGLQGRGLYLRYVDPMVMRGVRVLTRREPRAVISGG